MTSKKAVLKRQAANEQSHDLLSAPPPPHLLKYNRVTQKKSDSCTLRLKKDLFIKCDLSDVEKILARSWYRFKDSGCDDFQIGTNIRIGFHKYRKMSLQKFLLNSSDGLIPTFVDHSNRLDFRRTNLTLVTRKQQSRGFAKRRVQTTSIYKGVSYRKTRHQWAAMIKTDKKHLLIGYFESEDEAGLAYNKVAREHSVGDGFQNEIESKLRKLK